MYNTQDISNHLEINQLIQRYGKALDEKKYDLLNAVFAPDAELVYLLGEQLIKLPMQNQIICSRSFSPNAIGLLI